MFCKNCGAALSDTARFCAACGRAAAEPAGGRTAAAGGRVGYSHRISDPAFAKYIKNSNRWSGIFSIILAVVAVAGFYIAGEAGAEGMENPQALYIGLGIGGMFVVIALIQILRRNRSRTWDGVVEDKTVKKKTEQHTYGDNDVSYENYLEYTVVVRSEQGKRYYLRAKNDDTKYNYFQIGDRVRHHAGLNSYEKYDKSRDGIVFCNACGTLCDIGDDVCHRCKCPLLK